MGHIKEPVGIDLNIGPMPLSADDRQALSAVIAQYKQTKKVPLSKPKLAKATNNRRSTNTQIKERKPVVKKSTVTSSKK
jgi:hypothetical protein